MNKRAILLNGLSILAVIVNHTTSWSFTAMFWWTDQYRSVIVPNFDEVGTFHYYVLLVLRQLPVFAVPAFIFTSGFFISYVARGKQSTLSWKVVVARISNLLIPYTIWIVIIVIGDILQSDVHTLETYILERGYYFVPLMCQFYLLSPLLIPLAKNKPRLVLWVAGLLQWGTIGLWYASLVWKVPVLELATRVTPHWLFFRWGFYFTCGLAMGLHLRDVSQWLTAHKKALLIAVIVLGLLSILGPELLYRTTGTEWRSSSLNITTSLYAFVFILYFLAVDIPDWLSKLLRYFSGKTYGIYLTHDHVMEFVARVIRQLAPWILARQLLFFAPLVFAFGLGMPLLLMAAVRKSPLRKVYRYLFG
ncbi:MAG: acyltransferase [Anaerolineae bacterium]|nr:acyltransferase [Anaerolineae bacterium]